MDRIQPLRIMAGHLSDVDVSIFYSKIIEEDIDIMETQVDRIMGPLGVQWVMFN